MAIIYGTKGPDTKNGTKGNDTIYGWAKDDDYYDPSSNDTLNGLGGNDYLAGGTGNDKLYGNAGKDSLLGDRGVDTLFGGQGNDTLGGEYGNGDKLYGEAGDDYLDGVSGDFSDYSPNEAGDDSLFGGIGNVIYQVDSTSDTIVEYFNEGIDTVQTVGSSYTLGEGDNLENLYLVVVEPLNLSGIGNALNNSIEVFNEKGGNVTLDGKDGNDFLNASITPDGNYTLYGGNGNDTVTGGYHDDTLTGGAGNDILSGYYGNDSLKGGLGNDTLNGELEDDTLTGGAGADNFEYDTYIRFSKEIDTITDFVVADDTITLSFVLDGLNADAAITPAQFRIGSAAGDASDRFIYNKNTGALFFDEDGTGATKQVQFATLPTGLAMTNADIFVSG